MTGDGSPRLSVAADAAELATLAARVLGDALREAAARRSDGGGLLVVLAGGSTPLDSYAALAADATLPWTRLTVLPGDERAVPPSHRDSNTRRLRETLVRPGALAADRLVPLFDEDAPRDSEGLIAADGCLTALARLERALRAPPDLLLLGLGEDGHVASLFPRDAALHATTRAALVEHAPAPPRRRLTLTPPVLAAARTVLVLAAGSAKAPAVAAALEGSGPVEDCPARLVRGARWLLDRAAAGALRSLPPGADSSRPRPNRYHR